VKNLTAFDIFNPCSENCSPPSSAKWTFQTIGKVDQTPALARDGTLPFLRSTWARKALCRKARWIEMVFPEPRLHLRLETSAQPIVGVMARFTWAWAKHLCPEPRLMRNSGHTRRRTTSNPSPSSAPSPTARRSCMCPRAITTSTASRAHSMVPPRQQRAGRRLAAPAEPPAVIMRGRISRCP
jgi:hypothetical protein